MTENPPLPGLDLFDDAWLASLRWARLDHLDGLTRWRAYSSDGLRQWLVLRASEPAAPSAQERIDREYALAPCLDPAWAVQPLARLNTADGPALVLQDGGEPASEAGMGSFSIERFLTLALQASAALAQVHARGIVHQDICPEHLMVAADGRVRLTGFAGAILAEHNGREQGWIRHGRFAYLAPEAIASQAAGPATDLYALGVTFFQLLTGHLPFEAGDPLEWRQQHLAVMPPPLSRWRQGLPAALEQLVARLLHKQPEQRPESAQALEAQLWRHLNEWREFGTLGASARALPSGHAGIELVGREAPLQALLQAVEQLQRWRGGAVFISGEAGIGKTTLVRALRQRLTDDQLMFANAKCELARHHLPYGALCAALGSLFARLAGAAPAQAQAVAQRLRQALGDHGATLARLVPELEWLTGELPSASPPSVSEARRHLLGLFQQVFAAVATPERPLVLFLDDLQWVDPETRSFLAELNARQLRHLLLIAGCRDDALATDAALARLLAHYRELGQRCLEIELRPLAVDDVNALLAARLSLSASERDTLAARLHQRGAGNPLYVAQVIEVLQETGNTEDATQWPLFAGVEALLTTRLQGLPERTREVLGVLAMLGNHTPVEDLAAVTGTTPAHLASLLRPAVKASLLSEARSGLSFTHDTILETVRSRLPEPLKRTMHLQFAVILLGRLPPQAEADALFRVAGQVLRADHALLANGQRQAFINVLTQAADVAKAAAAPKAALRYLAHAQLLLAEAPSPLEPLAREVEFLQVQCLILDADYTAAQAYIAAALQRPCDALERAKLYRLSCEVHNLQGDYAGAAGTAATGLTTLGLSIALDPSAAQAEQAWEALLGDLAGRPPSVFLNLRPTADPQVEAIVELLASLMIPGSFIAPQLLLVTACQIARLTLAHGMSPASVPGLAWLGVASAHRFEAYALGLDFTRCAVTLTEQPRYASGRVSALIALDQVSVWTQPLPFALECAEQAYRASLALGSPSLACFSNNHIVSDLLVLGAPIERMLRQIDSGLIMAGNLEYVDAQSILHTQALYIRRLAGDIDAAVPIPERGELARRVSESSMGPLRFWWELFEGLFQFLEGSLEEAARRLDAAWALAWAVPAQIHLIDLALFSVLNRAALQTLTQAPQDYEQPMRHLRLWATLNPKYFADRLALAEAEVCRVRGDTLGALQGYEATIAKAAQCGAIHIQGLAHELAARCHHSAGLSVSARHHWRQARDAWRRWGAMVLAEQLEAEHPFLLEADRSAGGHPPLATSQQLDVMSITRACQALSREIELDSLVKTLLATTVMYAGATHAALLLVASDDALEVRATAHAGLDGVNVQLCQVAPSPAGLPLSLIHDCVRSRASLVINSPEQLRRYADDLYLGRLENGSAVCVPLLKQNAVIGVLYLENPFTAEVFAPPRVEVLEWLAAQAAISLSTATLYATLVEENQRRRESETTLERSQALLAIGQQVSRYATFSWKDPHASGFWSPRLLEELALPPCSDPRYLAAPELLVHPDDRHRFSNRLAKAIEQHQAFRLEFRSTPVDGHWHYLEVVAEPDGDEGFLGIISDISERRHTETALRAARSELNRTAQATILGELAASIAHEINQPLLSILTNAGASLRWLQRPEPEILEASEGLRDIKGQAQRAADIVTAIRALARQAPPEHKPLALDPLIQRVLALTQADIDDRQVALSLRLGAPGEVQADAVQLQQVVLNLVNNAVDAMQALPPPQRRLTVSSEPVPGGVLVMIEDTGPGIPPEQADKVFQAFYSTKASGMGMGLAICFSIINAHGGALHTHTGRGGEHLFLFTLPGVGAGAG
ncbi:ATP-binding sensor histidine kinase [Pseudomonas sp. RIT-PI-S]|uniref:trifunctional serine/threonine-protein kinase/ATP-binding protein/sensor histidine kinase n=1 Tax=Pseudomonas sp. RIT-PI-S TaxID=3035295 RepID=UPI0021D7F5B7|nr:ATP-binding sensor histidine kinase [Pseudomonas sp. RIT-PI-S]